MTVTGRCLCGAVRYAIDADPQTTRICWCRDCQYFAAGNATVNVLFPSAALRVQGETRDFVSTADSGNVMHRRFCATCGTPLFSASEARPHLVFVRAGTLDDRELARPDMTIWTSSAPSWACISDAYPKSPRQPAPLK